MLEILKESASMLTRDGVRLDADIYRPDTAGEFPVLLMRQPYGRAIASTVVYAHPTWYAAQGYIVVIQDVRGRGSSQGDFKLFVHEMEDGYDAVTWAAQLPGSTGQVGMYGFSYQGMTQLYAAAAQPPALKTLCPSMIGYDLYTDWAYEGGAFCYQLNLGWAIQLAAETARRQGNQAAYHRLYAASRSLPLTDPVNAHSALLEELAPDSFYHDWLGHPEPDDYWQTLSPQPYMAEVDLPMLHIGGWFDPYLRGTLHLYQDKAPRSQFPQHLWIGPWAHLPWGRRVGAMDYGAEAASPIDAAQIRWFDQFLKGVDTGLLQEPAVHLFELGSNQWHTFPAFPAPLARPCPLMTTGLAMMGDRAGTLLLSPEDMPLSEAMTDTVVHDPWRPAPALGGHATLPAGAFNRSALDDRTDILTYTSPVLTQAMHLVGGAIAELHITSDVVSFDLCVTLAEVKPNGAVYPISQGYRRCAPPVSLPLQIPLQATCICVPAGSALRLSLSAACFPAYAVTAGDGSPSGHGDLMNARVITLTLTCGGDPPSQIWLPQWHGPES